MPKSFRRPLLVPACLLLVAGCAGDPAPLRSSGAAGTTGNAGTSGAGGNSGSTGAAGGGSQGGTTGSGGDPGAAGTTGATGAAGTTGAGGSTGVGGAPGKPLVGMSAGCGMPPAANDSTKNFVLKEVHMTGLDPVYRQGGKYYDSSGKYDFTFRPYGLRLPLNYDPNKAYTVTFGGGGCGGSAADFAGNPGGGLQIDKSGSTIQIGLSYLTGCFNDGGPGIGDRTDTPEEPYFRAVLADVKAHYCVDIGRVFVSGYSSGGWEAYTLGCAAADVIRGISADEGGMREHRPPCKGPMAAMLVAGEADTTNPIGPLDKISTSLDSFGSAPGRDDLLKRNGCDMTAPPVAYSNPMYPACKAYKCPPTPSCGARCPAPRTTPARTWA